MNSPAPKAKRATKSAPAETLGTPAKAETLGTPAKAEAPGSAAKAEVLGSPVKKAAKKAAPVKRAAKSPADTPALIDPSGTMTAEEPKQTVVEQRTDETLVEAADVRIEAIAPIRVPADAGASETVAPDAEITVPKQAEPAEATSSITPKVFVGDVLAAGAAGGRTREDLPSDTALARAVKAQPLLTSAALALASVARFGESAREQADWLRSVYPKVGPERLARVALDSARKRTRYAVGATLLGGPLGVAAGVSTLAVAKARLIIDIAAIFGADPLDPERAVDVLVLLGAYADAPAASKAVAELIGDAVTDTAVIGDEVTTPRPTLVAAATAQLLTKAIGRLIPGMGALAQALRSTTETEQLTDRTIRYFKG